jgi:hypothetical protein
MNAYALAALVCFALLAISALVAVAAHLVGAVLSAPQRALLVAISFAAGFFTAAIAFVCTT